MLAYELVWVGLACLGVICGFDVASLRCGVFVLIWLGVACDLVGLVGLPVVLWVGWWWLCL